MYRRHHKIFQISLLILQLSYFSKPIAYIYNQSTATGIVPDNFKISKLRQYIMREYVTDTGNYRPTATLSPFPTVLERLSYDQLYAFLDKHNKQSNLDYPDSSGPR